MGRFFLIASCAVAFVVMCGGGVARGQASEEYAAKYEEFASRGMFVEAVAHFTEIIGSNPRDDAATYLRGKAYQALGELEASKGNRPDAKALNDKVPIDKTLIDKSPNDETPNDKALADYSRAIEIRPTAIRYLARAKLRLVMGLDRDKAAEDVEKALGIDSHYAQAYVVRGRLALPRKSALTDFKRACELAPDNPDTFYERGTYYRIKKEFARAIDDFNKAVEMKPAVERYRLGRAAAYTLNREYDKAIADYSPLIEASPNNAELYFHRDP